MAQQTSISDGGKVIAKAWGYMCPDGSILFREDGDVPILEPTRAECVATIAYWPQVYRGCKPVKLKITIEKA